MSHPAELIGSNVKLNDSPDSPSFATRGLLLFVCNKEICNPTMTYSGFYLQNYLFALKTLNHFPLVANEGEWGKARVCLVYRVN